MSTAISRRRNTTAGLAASTNLVNAEFLYDTDEKKACSHSTETNKISYGNTDFKTTANLISFLSKIELRIADGTSFKTTFLDSNKTAGSGLDWTFYSDRTGYIEDGDSGVNGTVIFVGSSGVIVGEVKGAYDTRWFGAVFDDSTDDLEAINNTITKVNSIGGGVVLLPPDMIAAVYGSVIMKSNVTLKGYGETSVIHQLDDSGIKTIINESRVTEQPPTHTPRDNDITIRDFKIINQGDVSTSDNDECIDCYYIDRFKVRNMWLENAKSHGVYSRFNNDVDIQNIYCKDTREQGVTVTYGDDIFISNVRAEGEFLNAVDVEPNAGDVINNITVIGALSMEDNLPGLAVIGDPTATIKDVNFSNVIGSNAPFSYITNGNISNIISKGIATNDVTSFQALTNVNISNIKTENLSATYAPFKASACVDCNFSNTNIKSFGGNTIGIDVTLMVNCKWSNTVLTGDYLFGVRHRNSNNCQYNGFDIENATDGFALTPTTSNSNTRITGFSVSGAVTNALTLSGAAGDVYFDGDVSNCTTPINNSSTGFVSVGNLSGRRRIVYGNASAPTSGTWVRGDVWINPNPSIGSWSEYQCISSGTPGLWRGVGQVGVIRDTTANRPTANLYGGYRYQDTTIAAAGAPIEYNGSNWVDSTGTIV